MGKAILITGGSGYFGNAFVKHLLAGNEYDRICIFSRDEFKQAQMRDRLNDDHRMRWFIGDVRDKERLALALRGVDVVVHAAALKRIEVGAYNPTEMVKTNVVGTMNVVEASLWAKVKTVVYLSTDKAYQPVSPYGQSKALAESIILAANNIGGSEGPAFRVTRYGNVANSTGSVIPKWRSILKSSKIVPVTHPDCTRFWMTEADAVNLVVDAIDNTTGKTMFIPPNMPAYRLGELAKAMNAEMDIVGLPQFEKKHETIADGQCSVDAHRLSYTDLKELLKEIPNG